MKREKREIDHQLILQPYVAPLKVRRRDREITTEKNCFVKNDEADMKAYAIVCYTKHWDFLLNTQSKDFKALETKLNNSKFDNYDVLIPGFLFYALRCDLQKICHTGFKSWAFEVNVDDLYVHMRESDSNPRKRCDFFVRDEILYRSYASFHVYFLQRCVSLWRHLFERNLKNKKGNQPSYVLCLYKFSSSNSS